MIIRTQKGCLKLEVVDNETETHTLSSVEFEPVQVFL